MIKTKPKVELAKCLAGESHHWIVTGTHGECKKCKDQREFKWEWNVWEHD